MTVTNEEKYMKIADLLPQVSDPVVHRFFDLESEELLDEKIEVLTALLKGKPPNEIPEYYKILEKMDNTQHWD